MTQTVLRDLAEQTLEFDGRQIALAETEWSEETLLNRRFSLKLFAVEGGGFVPWLEFQTNVPGEKPLIWFEDVDTINDAENFFYVFDPNELLPEEQRLTRQQQDDRLVVVKRLAKEYETVSFELLDQVREYLTVNESCDRVSANESKEKRSIWKKLGIG